MNTEQMLEDMRKCAKCVFLATDGNVAKDIARILLAGAEEIERLQAALNSLSAKSVPDSALETAIENSGGNWHEDIFHIEAQDLMNMLRSITAPQPPQVEDRVRELEKRAKRGDLLTKYSSWHRNAEEGYSYLEFRLPFDADLSCEAFRENVIDQAIAAMKEPNTLEGGE